MRRSVPVAVDRPSLGEPGISMPFVASDNHSSQVAIASARLILHINPISDPADGDSFQVFVADTVNGIPSIATEGWAYDSTTGSVVFGQLVGCNPDSLGDFDGSGTVDFLDFLQLAQNFEVSDHTFGDADCSGTVDFLDFLDFLALATNFGKSAGSASAESVPEPSGLWLLSLAAMSCFLVRGRRS